MQKKKQLSSGFTLIEILVVIGIIAILAGIVIVAINPARQFAQARNSQRTSDVNTILNAVGQNIADNKGIFTCNGTAFALGGSTGAASDISSTNTNANIASCLVPTYIPTMPFDPGNSNATTTPCVGAYTSTTSYESCYAVARDATTGRVTVSAPQAELNETISITR